MFNKCQPEPYYNTNTAINSKEAKGKERLSALQQDKGTKQQVIKNGGKAGK
jgi:hypothetical protein